MTKMGATVFTAVSDETFGAWLHCMENHADIHIVSRRRVPTAGISWVDMRSDRWSSAWNNKMVRTKFYRLEPERDEFILYNELKGAVL